MQFIQYDGTREILYAWVDEVYPMEKGVLIANPDQGFLFGSCFLGRKQVKHIVEQRKAEGKSIDEIKLILAILPETVLDYEFESLNANKKYPGSILRYKSFEELSWGLVAVLDQPLTGTRTIITAYLTSLKKIYKAKQKLHRTAAGETPHP